MVSSGAIHNKEGKIRLQIQGTGLRGANCCRLLFNPPIFEGIDYAISSTMPLAMDRVVLSLNAQSPRVQSLTSLTIFAVDTGAGFVFAGKDGQGIPIAAAETDDDVDFESFASQLDALLLKQLHELKFDIDKLCERLSKNANSVDLIVAAQSMLNARLQLAALEAAISEVRSAIEISTVGSLQPAAAVKLASTEAFMSKSNHYARLFQQKIRGCERIISHFLENAALKSVDIVFFQHAAGGFRVVYDNSIRYTISFSSLKPLDVQEDNIKAFLSRLDTLDSHHLEREHIESMSQALSMSDAESLRLLTHIKMRLYDSGYRVGFDATHPIVISLWGDDSPIGKSPYELHQKPLALEKCMVLQAPSNRNIWHQEKISFEAIHFVSKAHEIAERDDDADKPNLKRLKMEQL
jgi:hypothetical protein